MVNSENEAFCPFKSEKLVEMLNLYKKIHVNRKKEKLGIIGG